MRVEHIDSIRFYIPVSALPAYAEKYNADAIAVDYNDDKMRFEVYAFYEDEDTEPLYDLPSGEREAVNGGVIIASDLSDGSVLLYRDGETAIYRPAETPSPF